jgi:hypothetical protein
MNTPLADFIQPQTAQLRTVCVLPVLWRLFRPLLCAVLAVAFPAQSQTRCSACWSAVTNWQGTFSLTVTGGPLADGWTGQVNNSSQGTFWITNGVHAVHGTGSISSTANHPGCCDGSCGTYYASCNAAASGSLDATGRVGIRFDSTNCSYTLVIGDIIGNITVNNTDCSGSSQQSALGVASCDLAQPIGVGLGVLPYFPLPAFGEHLSGSGTFVAATAATGCSSFGQYTLTLTWDVRALSDPTPPTITQQPPGGPLGCNPTNIPSVSDILQGTSATTASGQVCLSALYVDVTNGCTITRSFAITATDCCSGAQAQALVAYWWTVDTVPPIFTRLPPGGNLGHNPPSVPDNAAALSQAQAIDTCSTPGITVTHVDASTATNSSRTFTVTALDACGNKATTQVVYTWTGVAGDAPAISMLRSGRNVVICWPSNATGFNLQSRSSLAPSSAWSPVTNLPALVGSQLMLTNNASGPARFFRLAR